MIAYALIAAFVATVLLAADGAYRWYRDAGVQVAEPSAPEPSVPERSVQAPEPAATETKHADSPPQTQGTALEGEVVGIAEAAAERPDAVPLPNLASGSIPNPAAAQVTGTATARAPDEAAPRRSEPRRTEPKSSQPKPQQGRRSPAKQTTRERAAPRRPVQAARPPAPAANPNVYYERDSQLGFAPQLRKRTCNPATGQMPMQCYYPREGRERFPAKPLD